jgi:hypothetical protein
MPRSKKVIAIQPQGEQFQLFARYNISLKPFNYKEQCDAMQLNASQSPHLCTNQIFSEKSNL